MKLRELKRTILLVTLIENKLKEENEIIDKVGSHLKACVNNKEYVAEKKVSCQKHYRFLDINVGDQKNIYRMFMDVIHQVGVIFTTGLRKRIRRKNSRSGRILVYS